MKDPPPAPNPTPSARPPTRWRSRLTLLAITSAFGFACAEVAVRMTGELDRDGAFSWRGTTAWPMPLTFTRHDELMAPLRAEFQPRLVYHESLGWSPNPIPQTFQGLYHTNDDGIRTGADRARFATRAADGVSRIVLVGDSFTYCDELPYEESWGKQLENALNAAGHATEVINLGVSGYGMDQALLRLRTHGLPLAPDFVIFGLRPENVARNLSIVRLFYKHGSKIPYTKPRFVLEGEDGLRLVNSPALRPEDLNRMLHDDSIRDWGDIHHDPFAAPYLAPRRPWHASRVASLVERLFVRDVPNPDTITHDPDSDPMRLALAILRAADHDAKSVGARMLVLHLSTKSTGKTDPIVDVVDDHFPTIDTHDQLRRMLKSSGKSLIRREGSHYTRHACAIVGEYAAEELRKLAN